jgi:hypothetical protein
MKSPLVKLTLCDGTRDNTVLGYKVKFRYSINTYKFNCLLTPGKVAKKISNVTYFTFVNENWKIVGVTVNLSDLILKQSAIVFQVIFIHCIDSFYLSK